FLALLDQFPKLAGFAERLVLRSRQFAAEEEIPKRILVQNAMNLDSFLCLGEVNPVIFGAIAIQLFSSTLDHTEMFGVQTIEVLRQNLKLLEQIELHFLRQRRHLSRAQLVENDLEHG